MNFMFMNVLVVNKMLPECLDNLSPVLRVFYSEEYESYINYGHRLRLITWFNFNLSIEKIITSIIKCGMKKIIHSQTSTVQPLNLGNG